MNRQALMGLLALEAVLTHVSRQAKENSESHEAKLRGTGRSTSLALKQAQAAMDAATRGSGIEIHDHHNTAEAHVEQAKRVSNVLRALNVEHTLCGNVIEVEPRKAEPEQQLPEWAVGINTDLQLVAGAQLLTKNGRRCGNAAISCVHEEEHGTVYCVVTDVGNAMRLNKDEVNELFEIGDYLMDPREVASRLK